MLATFLLAFQAAAAPGGAMSTPAATPSAAPSATVYHGRAGQLSARIPMSDATITVDGMLDEPVWRTAAILTGFSLYAPVDQRPAPDSTEVLVWYSATAIHFGIRAWAPAGTVRATLADRDKIYADDYIGIFLGTYNDGRQATVLAVNPFGVQGDGVVVESGVPTSASGSTGMVLATARRTAGDGSFFASAASVSRACRAVNASATRAHVSSVIPFVST